MTEVVVIDAVRTPFGRRGGALSTVHPVDLLAETLASLLGRSGVSPDEVGHVVAGCVEKAGEQGFNIARTAWLAAGLPVAVPATTVDVQCGSSQEAFTLAYALVAAGLVEVAVAAGVESMSRVPMGYTFTSGPGNPIPPSFLERFPMPDQFASAERIAAKWGVTREDCDALAVASATRAAAAWEQARFAGQIVAAHGLERDECLRVTSSESVAALAPIAPGAVHTAATASKIADGASAVLLMSARRAEVLALTPKVTVRDSALIGVDPSLMLTGPIDVTEMLLQRNNFSATDLAVVEINEAFASVALAWAAEFDVDPARVNPNGGALAMGHPLGATGTGLITKAIHELERIGSGHALVTMCCGGALGTGTLMSR